MTAAAMVAALRAGGDNRPIVRDLPDGGVAEYDDARLAAFFEAEGFRYGAMPHQTDASFAASGGLVHRWPVGSPEIFHRLATRIKTDGTQDLPVAELQVRYGHLGRNGRLLDRRTVKKALDINLKKP